MRYLLLAFLILILSCNKREFYISKGDKSEYIFFLKSGHYFESVDEGDRMVVITVYKKEVYSIDGLTRKKGIIARFRIEKIIKNECDKEWQEDLNKNTIIINYSPNK